MRRSLAFHLFAHDIANSLRQPFVAAMSTATKAEGAGDSRLQLVLKALEPRPVEKVKMTDEELAEAAQRFVLVYVSVYAFHASHQKTHSTNQ